MASPRLLRWLFLVALAMRAAVPSGFMLDAARATGPALVACDGHGPVLALAMAHHGPHRSGEGSQGDCAGSAAGALDAPASTSFVPIEASAVDAPSLSSRQSDPLLSSTASRPPSTGPPPHA